MTVDRICMIVLVALLLVVLGIFVYQCIIDPLMRFERLEIYHFFGWTANSDGEIRQASFDFFNNGTKHLTIKEIWVNGTLMHSYEWGCHYGSTLGPKGDTWVFVAPEKAIFENGKTHNFTIGTSSGNNFSFIIKIDDESVKPENLTIKDWHFGILPQSGIPGGYRYISVRVKNSGDTPVIITKVDVNGTVFYTKQWINPHALDSIIVDYEWRVGTYHIYIDTAAGSTYDITATAEQP